MTVEKANFLVLLPAHVVHTLVGLNISDLEGKKELHFNQQQKGEVVLKKKKYIKKSKKTGEKKSFLIQRRVNEVIMTLESLEKLCERMIAGSFKTLKEPSLVKSAQSRNEQASAARAAWLSE